MQPPLASPRALLTESIVRGLLIESPSIEVTYGADVLNQSDLSVAADLTPYMSDGSSITRSNYATVHGGCALKYDNNAPFNSMNQLLRPWQTITDVNTDASAQFYLGVYTMTSPELDISILPSVVQATGYDQLYFLDNPIGDSVQFSAGTNAITNALNLLQSALTGMVPTVTYETSAYTLSSDYVKPMDDTTTYLTVINELLSLAGYRGLWVDWVGTFQMHPYVAPLGLPVDWQFNVAGAENIVAESRSVTQDVWGVPNWWRFVMNGVDVAPVEGSTQYTYVNDNPADPSSFANRNHYYRSIKYVDAANYAALVSSANITINADKTPSATFQYTTSPFPLAWHFDQLIVSDPNLEGSYARVQARSWELPLDGKTDMSWVWEII